MDLSVKVSSWVWENGPDKAAAKLLLLALADHSNDDGICYPSLLRLEKMTGCKGRYLRNIRDELIESGYISVISKGSGRRSSIYRINYDGTFLPETSSVEMVEGGPIQPPRVVLYNHPKVEVESGPIEPPRVVAQNQSGWSPATTQGGPIQPPNHNITIIEPSVEPLQENEKPKKKRKRTARDDIWDALVEFFGEPSTTSSRSMFGKAVKELVEAGATPEEVLTRAEEAAKRWSYVFTPQALLKHWDSLAVEQKEQSELRGNAQLGKSYLNFDYKDSKELVEGLGGKVYNDD